ncbi:Wadjet anti-phage system protein JetD domain-containing protein [Dietzia aurantiaca]|uniref:Wadjet anti-phage system protein JetD domain-containing protein n=1 Tax=Dietzia aurantiaca TaxID=983873 RepID=A0ABV9PX28_9ACTN
MTGPEGKGPRSPHDLADTCATRFKRRHRDWLADPDAAASDTVRFATSMPTAARAADDPTGTAGWIRAWRNFDSANSAPGVQVTWAERRLAGFGVVSLPHRVEVRGARDIARIGGQSARWSTLLDRAHRIRALGPDHVALRRAAAGTAPVWEKFDDEDMAHLLTVCRWAIDNPTVGLTAREVAVPGIDTKWIESRVRIIEQLVDAARAGRGGSASGSGLGLRGPGPRLRLRILDPLIGFPLRDVESPVDQLATLWSDSTGPRHLVVVENLTTFLALPAIPGAVALFGRGYAVDAVAALPWALRARIVYWGDLDSHGFAILDRLRHHAPHAASVLMDHATFDAWRQFSVSDPTPTRAARTRLTAEELDTLELLTAAGDLRLEQERIPWDWALPHLTDALRAP